MSDFTLHCVIFPTPMCGVFPTPSTCHIFHKFSSVLTLTAQRQPGHHRPRARSSRLPHLGHWPRPLLHLGHWPRPGPPALWLGSRESRSPEPPGQVLCLLAWLTELGKTLYLLRQFIVKDTNESTHEEPPDTEASVPWHWDGTRASRALSSETWKLFASRCAGVFIKCYYVTMMD